MVALPATDVSRAKVSSIAHASSLRDLAGCWSLANPESNAYLHSVTAGNGTTPCRTAAPAMRWTIVNSISMTSIMAMRLPVRGPPETEKLANLGRCRTASLRHRSERIWFGIGCSAELSPLAFSRLGISPQPLCCGLASPCPRRSLPRASAWRTEVVSGDLTNCLRDFTYLAITVGDDAHSDVPHSTGCLVRHRTGYRLIRYETVV
jgi:hypothetical protein